MRRPTVSLGLGLAALILSACAGPTPVERHWGSAQRGASEAMSAAAGRQPGRGIDAAGASAAYDNYVESLEPCTDEGPEVLLDVIEND
jgi:hypothetical protein